MASKDSKEDKDALDALELEAKEFDKVGSRQSCSIMTPANDLQDAEIDRILKAFRLDAYAVLDLQPGVPDSDIKITYRKKSLLIHPDKTKNPLAPDAFDRLKKAQTELMDEKHRERLDEAIADARMLLMRENKWTPDSEELKTEDFRKMWRIKARDVLIDAEHRRRRQMKAQLQEEGREQRRTDAELEERKRKRQHEQDWESTRDERISSWRSFQKGQGGDKKKKKKLKPIG
ncbi:DnaJ sub C member 8 [Fusarium irregulare]|uniref:DnaJ sub C member 8 n=1 Tax=Fusarium irregulare TaxID=2494466 RepID=A0A9W8UBH2_9HYPO|nr:DnaJ sub C member 8 [Fusarium irregulare]